ncbi:MAG: winged helix-turn-helix transcriptional regulator [Candidatus Nanoarchaeia archaeon]
MAVVSIPTQEKIKLDLYDKKIIFYLSQNSRLPLSELAKKLRISIQRCKYKVDRLKKEVLEPAPFLTYPLLNMNSYLIFAPQLKQEDIDEIMNEESIYFMLQSIGKYQYVLNIITDDIDTFCEKYLGEYHIEVLPIINTYSDNFNPFNLKIPPKFLLKNKQIALDKKDYLILQHISKNSDDSLLGIQNATSIDRQTIKDRIKKMEGTNIIQKFRYGLNVFKIGSLAYILRIKVIAKNKKLILETIRSNNFSGFVFETYDGFTMHFLPFSHNQVFEFTKTLSQADSTVQIDVIQNTESYKINLVPESVIKEFQRRSRV